VAETAALYDLGASDVIPEEFETSVEIFNRVLARYLIPRDQIDRFTRKYVAWLRDVPSPSGRGPTTADLQLRYPELEIKRLGRGGIDRGGQDVDDSTVAGLDSGSVCRPAAQWGADPDPGPGERLVVGDVLYVMGDAKQCVSAARSLTENKKG
jgi:CPA2 family monovalent cation:H+ antiporter-2